jgi:hypothetical protein
MDIFARRARKHLAPSHLPSGELGRARVFRSERDTNVAIRDDSGNFALFVDHRQDSALALPHERGGFGEIGP